MFVAADIRTDDERFQHSQKSEIFIEVSVSVTVKQFVFSLMGLLCVVCLFCIHSQP